MSPLPPPPRVTPVGHALDDALADGEWHPIEDLLVLLIPHVPPGQAHRRAESQRRRSQREQAGIETERQRGDVTTAVAAGARDIARDAIRWKVTRGTAERDGDRIRRRP